MKSKRPTQIYKKKQASLNKNAIRKISEVFGLSIDETD